MACMLLPHEAEEKARMSPKNFQGGPKKSCHLLLRATQLAKRPTPPDLIPHRGFIIEHISFPSHVHCYCCGRAPVSQVLRNAKSGQILHNLIYRACARQNLTYRRIFLEASCFLYGGALGSPRYVDIVAWRLVTMGCHAWRVLNLCRTRERTGGFGPRS